MVIAQICLPYRMTNNRNKLCDQRWISYFKSTLSKLCPHNLQEWGRIVLFVLLRFERKQVKCGACEIHWKVYFPFVENMAKMSGDWPTKADATSSAITAPGRLRSFLTWPSPTMFRAESKTVGRTDAPVCWRRRILTTISLTLTRSPFQKKVGILNVLNCRKWHSRKVSLSLQFCVSHERLLSVCINYSKTLPYRTTSVTTVPRLPCMH